MAQTFTFDPAHSRIGFAVRHFKVVTVAGRFTDFSGEVRLEGDGTTGARGTLSIRTASIDTGRKTRDWHLRTPGFFDAKRYPAMTFRSTGIEAKDENAYRVVGDLTIRGVTKPVTLEVTVKNHVHDPAGNETVALSATGVIKRSDWKLTLQRPLEAGGVVIDDMVKLEIEAALVHPAVASLARTAQGGRR